MSNRRKAVFKNHIIRKHRINGEEKKVSSETSPLTVVFVLKEGLEEVYSNLDVASHAAQCGSGKVLPDINQ